MIEERKYWDPELETMPLEKLKKLQEEKLQATVTHAYNNTKFYRRKFDQAGVKPADINVLDDLQKLPLIESAEEFRKASFLDRLAVPLGQVRSVTSSSGTTGVPDIIPFTKSDWESLIYQAEPRIRWTHGIRPTDVVQVLTNFRCCERAPETLGAMVIRADAGRGNLDNQIRVAQAMGVTVIEHLPSLVLRYFERAKELGFDIRQSKIRLISGVGESWAEAFKKRIEAEYGIPFRTAYGCIELAAAGVAGVECEAGNGMHISSDCIIVEVIDPETLRPLGFGEEGELVVTPLVNEAMPVIRLRTGDVASLLPYKPCPCGRTHPKMSVVKGRLAHIVKVKGKKILPIDVEEVVASIPSLGNEYQIILDKPGELERLKVKVEAKAEVKDIKALQKQVEEALVQSLGVDTEVELVPIGILSRSLFKAERLITSYK